jgi:hypothetical protein
MNKTGYLNGPYGEKSSKRLWGSVLIAIGTAIGLGSCAYGLFYPIGASEFIKSIVEVFVFSGCGLELGGIADKFKIKR